MTTTGAFRVTANVKSERMSQWTAELLCPDPDVEASVGTSVASRPISNRQHTLHYLGILDAVFESVRRFQRSDEWRSPEACDVVTAWRTAFRCLKALAVVGAD